MTCLKFPDEQTAITLMPQYRNEDQWITASHSHALDPIGTLYAETGEVATVDGIETKLTAPLPGWHMNFQGELPEELLPFVVEPMNPKVVWA